MITDYIDSDFIRKCIPNVMFEVDGEQPIADKLTPFIENASNRLVSEYLMPGDFLKTEDLVFAQQLIVINAFIDAVPSLDIVVTPTGFGVVNTETIAPASKERIERLIDSLRHHSESLLEFLLERVLTYPEWRSSERGKYFCSTFLSNTKDVAITGADSYDNMRSLAMQHESFIARHFLGPKLMERLREEYNARDTIVFLELHQAVRSVVIECVRGTLRKNIMTPDIVWGLFQPVLYLLQQNQEYYSLWQEEMGNLFDHLQFKNDIKGSYYF